MLNYFTTSNSFRRTLPDVANLTAMNVWDGVCMCFVFTSFIEFVIVNCTGRRKVKLNSCNAANGNISKVSVFVKFPTDKMLNVQRAFTSILLKLRSNFMRYNDEHKWLLQRKSLYKNGCTFVTKIVLSRYVLKYNIMHGTYYTF